MILIGGGGRSGKSSAALRMAAAAGPRVGFIATAETLDDEMKERAAQHRRERSDSIVTWEEPFSVAERIDSEAAHFDAIVVDCLTLWVSNLLLADGFDLRAEFDGLVEAAASAKNQIILVTNEVGCGIIPDNALARRFRDEAGKLNQLCAARAEEVYWMAFGLSLKLK